MIPVTLKVDDFLSLNGLGCSVMQACIWLQEIIVHQYSTIARIIISITELIGNLVTAGPCPANRCNFTKRLGTGREILALPPSLMRGA